MTASPTRSATGCLIRSRSHSAASQPPSLPHGSAIMAIPRYATRGSSMSGCATSSGWWSPTGTGPAPIPWQPDRRPRTGSESPYA
ncbi:hypothetical protein RAA17_00765 [Komagataeibacter rhaeticus]|nr:hypothetical protein [Komagataeibacter rhaeticus]